MWNPINLIMKVNYENIFFPNCRVCRERDVIYNCWDEYWSKVCFYQNEIEILNKIERISKKTLDMVCVNDGNEFYQAIPNIHQCIVSHQIEIDTCINEAMYAVVKQIFQKFIENEHFALKISADDCM